MGKKPHEFFTSPLHQKSVDDMRMSKKIIGKFLHDRRWKQDLTPEQLSRRSGISVKTINQIEMGKGKLEWGIVARLAIALGKPLSEYLWEGE